MIRTPFVADRFYDADPDLLLTNVEQWLHPASSSIPITPLPAHMVMLPHAGHMYCGALIGHTLSRVTLPQRLVMLGTNHTGLGGSLSVWPEGAWQTPLGLVPVDEETAQALTDSQGGYSADYAAHGAEHSLEVLLPFLQRHIPDVRITPVAVNCAPQNLEAAGLALGETLARFHEQGEHVGIVISTEMHHSDSLEQTKQLDSLALQAFLSLNPAALYNTVRTNNISMCGVLAATLALFAAQSVQLSKAALVCYGNSSEVDGDLNNLVGYAGAYVV